MYVTHTTSRTVHCLDVFIATSSSSLEADVYLMLTMVQTSQLQSQGVEARLFGLSERERNQRMQQCKPAAANEQGAL